MQGWKWEDEDWHIDRSSAFEEAVDADGWSYAVDFPWLRLPPAPGSGRQRKVHVRSFLCLMGLAGSHKPMSVQLNKEPSASINQAEPGVNKQGQSVCLDFHGGPIHKDINQGYGP